MRFTNNILIIRIDFLYLSNFVRLSFIYLSIVGICLLIGSHTEEEIVFLINSYFIKHLFDFYCYLKEYLMLHEIERATKELEVINSEILRVKSETQTIESEIEALKKSSLNLRKALLTDTTGVELQLKERHEELAKQQVKQSDNFWGIFKYLMLWETSVIIYHLLSLL